MLLLSLFTSFSLLFAVNHEYHVGIYEIDIKSNEIQISQKLFVDDFEKALYLSGKAVKFGDDLNEERLSEALQAYILKHFRISHKGEKMVLNFVGSEWEDYHAIYLYWQVTDIPVDLNSLDIFNDIFLEVSEDQQNMHRIKKDGKEKSMLLEKNKTTDSVKF